ncbi:MAG TPA: type III secretion inner membrane ring lipoprotein SctJ [Luteimonas sp.]|nr:type III secretion inner membrane ring lipoprotein SctJ [Luteimonas sp.]
MSLVRPTCLRAVLLGLLACLLLAGCGRTALYSQLEEQQANELMGALLAAGVDAEKGPSPSKTGWEVRVDRSDFPYAMQVLTARGLPRAQYATMCDIFKKEGFASSATEEKGRYICSLQQELSRTLSRFDGVVEARVHIALPDRDPLGGANHDSSASVVIFEQPGANVRDRETDIKVLIKDSVEGLGDINKVSVKFATVSAPPATRPQGAVPVALSSMSPLAIGIAAAVLVLLGLLFAFWSRFRGAAQAKAVPAGKVWNG